LACAALWPSAYPIDSKNDFDMARLLDGVKRRHSVGEATAL
jgi:hypothetical protein